MTASAPPQALPVVMAGRGHQITAATLKARAARIRLLRMVLLGSAAVVVVVAGLSIAARLAAPVAGVEQATIGEGGQLSINAPRFFGRAGDGSTVEIEAASAQRDTTDIAAAVVLDRPSMSATDGTRATASSGSWQEASQTLVLRGEVDVTLPDGGKTTADEAIWRPAEDGTGGGELVLSGRVTMTRAGGDVIEAQQATWQSSAGRLLLYGATSVRQANGDAVSAPAATWVAGTGTLTMDGGAEYRRNGVVIGRAGSLAWSRDRGIAELSGGVEVMLANGSARSRSARIEMGGQRVSGSGDVQITGPLGTATAQQYVYESRTGRMVLSGRARITARR